jgi:hypothetical protein
VPIISDLGDSSGANQEHNSFLVLDVAERFLRGKRHSDIRVKTTCGYVGSSVVC